MATVIASTRCTWKKRVFEEVKSLRLLLELFSTKSRSKAFRSILNIASDPEVVVSKAITKTEFDVIVKILQCEQVSTIELKQELGISDSNSQLVTFYQRLGRMVKNGLLEFTESHAPTEKRGRKPKLVSVTDLGKQRVCHYLQVSLKSLSDDFEQVLAICTRG